MGVEVEQREGQVLLLEQLELLAQLERLAQQELQEPLQEAVGVGLVEEVEGVEGQGEEPVELRRVVEQRPAVEPRPVVVQKAKVKRV